MDIRVVLTAFSAVFLAELADKTQLVGLGLASKTGKPWSVFLGSVGGYMLVTILTVLIGALLGRHIKPEYIRLTGGTLFILIGILFFLNKL